MLVQCNKSGHSKLCCDCPHKNPHEPNTVDVGRVDVCTEEEGCSNNQCPPVQVRCVPIAEVSK